MGDRPDWTCFGSYRIRFQTVNCIDQPPGDIDHFHGLPLLRFDRNFVLGLSWYSTWSIQDQSPFLSSVYLGPKLLLRSKSTVTLKPWPEKSLDQIPNFKPRKPFLKCQANDPPNIYHVC